MDAVERFRCQHCYVEHVGRAEDGTTTPETVRRALQDNVFGALVDANVARLKRFADADLGTGVVNRLAAVAFGSDMTSYDPQDFLLPEIFTVAGDSAVFAALSVRWRDSGPMKLFDVYEWVADGDDVQTMFDYQVLIIETVRNMFYVQLVDGAGSVTGLYEALGTFVRSIVLNSYPSHLYEAVDGLRRSVGADVRSTGFPHALSPATKTTVRKYLATAAVLAGAADRAAVARVPMAELLADILALDGFGRFTRAFKLLSYESNALDGYRGTSPDHGSQAIGPRACDELSALRRNLLSLHMLTVTGFARNAAAAQVSAAKAYVFDNVLHVNNTFAADHERVRRIVLPLAVRFRHANDDDDEDDDDGFAMLQQVVLLNVHLIEHLELNGCAAAQYTVDVFRTVADGYLAKETTTTTGGGGQRLLYGRLWSERSAIIERVERDTREHRMSADKRHVHAMSVDRFVPAVDDDERSADPARAFLWDGQLERSVESAYSGMSRATVDYQRLVAVHLFAIKWHLQKIVTKTSNVVAVYDASHAKRQLDGHVRTTHECLTRLRRLPFPKRVAAHVRRVVRTFDSVFEDLTAENVNGHDSAVSGHRELLGPSVERYDSFPSRNTRPDVVRETNDSIAKDIDVLEGILKRTNESRIISDVPFSACIQVF